MGNYLGRNQYRLTYTNWSRKNTNQYYIFTPISVVSDNRLLPLFNHIINNTA